MVDSVIGFINSFGNFFRTHIFCPSFNYFIIWAKDVVQSENKEPFTKENKKNFKNFKL